MSMMKLGNVAALPSVCRDHLTNTPRTIVTNPPRTSLVLIRVSKHQSVIKLTTIQPLVFSCT